MRVFQFIMLFLALVVVCGCSHRRIHRTPVATSVCSCEACQHEQQQLIDSGAVPEDYFERSEAPEPSETITPETIVTTNEDLLLTEPQSNELSPEYASDSNDEVVDESPFSSGNPVDMNNEAPRSFNVPAVDEVNTPPPNIKVDNSSSLTLEVKPDDPSIQDSTQTSPEDVFQPSNREIFEIKTEPSKPIPLNKQPSILIDQSPESNQFDSGSTVPTATPQLTLPLSESASNNGLQIPDTIVSVPLTFEPYQPAITQSEDKKTESQRYVYKPITSKTLREHIANTKVVTAEPARQPEIVVEGDLYENPIVLNAQPKRSPQIAKPIRTQDNIQPASTQEPIEQQSIAQNSELDPVYGLPLSNNVNFHSLPAIEESSAGRPREAQHLHIHIHHEYDNAALAQSQIDALNGQAAANVQVMYGDDKSQVIIAPPTPTTNITPVQPNGDRRTYYIPPKQILRLKAVSPIGQGQPNPSVANIQMQDTVVHGGTHLLTTPEYRARPVHKNHGLPGIDHAKLRRAFKASPSSDALR